MGVRVGSRGLTGCLGWGWVVAVASAWSLRSCQDGPVLCNTTTLCMSRLWGCAARHFERRSLGRWFGVVWSGYIPRIEGDQAVSLEGLVLLCRWVVTSPFEDARWAHQEASIAVKVF